MRQLILLLFLLFVYVAGHAQPFVVDTSYTPPKNFPVHMKVNPNGKTVWVSFGDSANASMYYFNSFQQGVGQVAQRIIAPREYTIGLAAFDWEEKLVWVESAHDADSLFFRWLNCDINGNVTLARKTSLAMPGFKMVVSGRYLNGRILLLLAQWAAHGGIQNLSLHAFDTLGNLLEIHPILGIANTNLLDASIRSANVSWLNDSSWIIQTSIRDTTPGGQLVILQSVSALDYAGNLRWTVAEFPFGNATWADESEVYIWESPQRRLRAYWRTGNSLQLRWEKNAADLGLSNDQMEYPLFSKDANGITMVGNDTSYHMAILRMDLHGNVIWHRKHLLWHAPSIPPQFPQNSHENLAAQIHRNAARHYWIFGVQREVMPFINYEHSALWYAYLDSNGCVNQQCTPLAVEETAAKSAIGLHSYPNPANDLLHVNFKTGQSLKNVELRLSDMQGRIRSQTRVNDVDAAHILPVHELEPGIYVLQLILDGRLVAFEKVVVGR